METLRKDKTFVERFYYKEDLPYTACSRKGERRGPCPKIKQKISDGFSSSCSLSR